MTRELLHIGFDLPEQLLRPVGERSSLRRLELGKLLLEWAGCCRHEGRPAGSLAPRDLEMDQRGSGLADGDEAEAGNGVMGIARSEEHTSELQELMRISYAVSCLTNKT